MKKIVLVFLCVLSFGAQSKPILSGYSGDRPVYYEDTSIVSYGKVVTGKTTDKGTTKDNAEKYESVSDYIYFCPFDSLHSTSSRTDYYDLQGKPNGRNIQSDSASETTGANLSSDEKFDRFFGLSQFRIKLKSKCSSAKKQLPKIEIAITHNEKHVFHVFLDSIKRVGNLKSAWVKQREIVGKTMNNEDGTPFMMDDGLPFKTYAFDKEKGYLMLEYQIDCKNQKLDVSQSVKYDSVGSVIDSMNFPIDPKNMEGIVPNSIGEVIHEFVCAI